MSTAPAVASLVLDALGGSADTYKLQKLVYYCQAWHVTQTKRPMFDGVIQAWRHGPVAVDLWPFHKGHFRVTSAMVGPGGGTGLDDYALAVLRSVVQYYGQFESHALVDLTHAEEPWRSVYVPGRNNPITTDAMRSYYSKLLAGDGPVPDLPRSSIRYVTGDQFDTLVSAADDDSVNARFAAAVLRGQDRA